MSTKSSFPLRSIMVAISLLLIVTACGADKPASETESDGGATSVGSVGFSDEVIRSPEFRNCIIWLLQDHEHQYVSSTSRDSNVSGTLPVIRGLSAEESKLGAGRSIKVTEAPYSHDSRAEAASACLSIIEE